MIPVTSKVESLTIQSLQDISQSQSQLYGTFGTTSTSQKSGVTTLKFSNRNEKCLRTEKEKMFLKTTVQFYVTKENIQLI